MPTEPLIRFTDAGFYCPRADIHIDPVRPVARALITHGHADHARYGHASYLCTPSAAPVMRHRLGDITLQTQAYGAPLDINGVSISFHPAGHVIGSAQIRLTYKGEVWVISGDYKLERDGISEPFEPVRCTHFISECTFGLPVFRWQPQAEIAQQINDWWRSNASAGRATLLGSYSLGKAQRILSLLDTSIGPILTHGAIEATNEVLRAQGIALPDTTQVTAETSRDAAAGAFVIAPPSALGSTWAGKLGPVSAGFASGWMQLRGIKRRRSADRGFIMSDHADWPDLLGAIKQTGAEHIYVTHGYTEVFAHYLSDIGYDAHVVPNAFAMGQTDGEDG